MITFFDDLQMKARATCVMFRGFLVELTPRYDDQKSNNSRLRVFCFLGLTENPIISGSSDHSRFLSKCVYACARV